MTEEERLIHQEEQRRKKFARPQPKPKPRPEEKEAPVNWRKHLLNAWDTMRESLK